MKQILTIFFVLILASAAVSAACSSCAGTGLAGPGGAEDTGNGAQAVKGEQVSVQKGEPVLYQQGEGNQTRERNRERLETGLQNALTRVTNENARQRLQQNIERFQLNYQERMQRMEGLEIEDVDNETGAATIRAREEVRFLGFIKGKATKRFEMDDKGNINERAPWYRFLYREVESEE